MDEIGIDISDERPKLLATDSAAAAEVVVTMGCGTHATSSPASAMGIGRSTIPPAAP